MNARILLRSPMRILIFATLPYPCAIMERTWSSGSNSKFFHSMDKYLLILHFPFPVPFHAISRVSCCSLWRRIPNYGENRYPPCPLVFVHLHHDCQEQPVLLANGLISALWIPKTSIVIVYLILTITIVGTVKIKMFTGDTLGVWHIPKILKVNNITMQIILPGLQV